MIHDNVKTDFSGVHTPVIDPSAFIHPLAAAIGNISIGKRVMVAPFASIRGDEGQPIFVGDDSNVQEGVVIHGLETEHRGVAIDENMVEADGGKYSVFIGSRVSLAHQAQIHGPSLIGDGTFIGMKSFIFRSLVGRGAVIEPGCHIMGVSVPAGRYVPAGTILKEQGKADSMPRISDDYPLKDINRGVVRVNVLLAEGYRKALG